MNEHSVEQKSNKHRVLIVDDEPNVHVALTRQLKPEPIEIHTADCGDAALELFKRYEFAVIVADYMMPKMNGIELLKTIQNIYPDTVRVLFTAYSEANIAIDAINQGGIYRYIVKPWNGKEIRALVREAVSKYHLIKLNKKLFEFTKIQNNALVEKTKEIEVKNQMLKRLYEDSNLSYIKSIQIFTSLLEVYDPWLMQHSKRVADLAGKVCDTLHLDETMKKHVEFASLLHDIGLIGIPKALSRKKFSLCSDDEKQLLKNHTIIGQSLVNKDIKFEGVATIIRSHHERYDGKGFPDQMGADQIPLGARILAVVDAYDSLLYPQNIYDRSTPESVKGYLYNNRNSRFDPKIIDAFLLSLEGYRQSSAKPAEDILKDSEEDTFI